MIGINVPVPVPMSHTSAAGRTPSSATTPSTAPRASASSTAPRSSPPARQPRPAGRRRLHLPHLRLSLRGHLMATAERPRSAPPRATSAWLRPRLLGRLGPRGRAPGAAGPLPPRRARRRPVTSGWSSARTATSHRSAAPRRKSWTLVASRSPAARPSARCTAPRRGTRCSPMSARSPTLTQAAVLVHHLVLIPPMYLDEKTGQRSPNRRATAAQWAGFGKAADRRRAGLLLDEYDVRLVIQPHADSQHPDPAGDRTAAQRVRQPVHQPVPGHRARGLRRWRQRRPDPPLRRARRYVHIKQMDPEILAEVAAEDLGFGEAVKRGRVLPPAGVPNPADVVAELAKLDADLFVIVEQDLYPCAPRCRCRSRPAPAPTWRTAA